MNESRGHPAQRTSRRPIGRLSVILALTGAAVVSVVAHAAEPAVPAPSPRPSPAQLAWQDLGFAVRVPYGLGPFLDREVGDGHDDPALFAPAEVRPDQWVRTAQSAGARLLVFTAKQRDGFCLWPSRFTEHSVRNAPWQQGRGDLVRDLALACRAAGVRFGLEYALFDHHAPAAANPAADNQCLQRQLRQLPTEFGPLPGPWPFSH